MKQELLPIPDIEDLDLNFTSAFFGDGRGYVQITFEMVGKIKSGELVITEYQKTSLGDVIYVSANSKLQ